MTDQDTTTADEPSDETRLDRLEQTQAEQGNKLDAILDKLGSINLASHAQAQERTEHRLDRGSSLAEQVRAELDKAKQDEAAQRAADDEKSERAQLREQVARLSEKPPAPPRNPLKGLATMGWGDA